MVNSINYWSISSQILEKEAKNLGLEIKIISRNKNTFYIIGNGKKYLFKSTDFGGNSSLASKISNDKKLTYQLLDDLNFPIAKSIYINKIDLRGNTNLGTGGTGKCYTNIICEENKKNCIDICEKFGFEICGIDIISKDISKPLRKNGGIILELNDNPGLGGDLELTGINTGKIILKKLFF